MLHYSFQLLLWKDIAPIYMRPPGFSFIMVDNMSFISKASLHVQKQRVKMWMCLYVSCVSCKCTSPIKRLSHCPFCYGKQHLEFLENTLSFNKCRGHELFVLVSMSNRSFTYCLSLLSLEIHFQLYYRNGNRLY